MLSFLLNLRQAVNSLFTSQPGRKSMLYPRARTDEQSHKSSSLQDQQLGNKPTEGRTLSVIKQTHHRICWVLKATGDIQSFLCSMSNSSSHLLPFPLSSISFYFLSSFFLFSSPSLLKSQLFLRKQEHTCWANGCNSCHPRADLAPMTLPTALSIFPTPFLAPSSPALAFLPNAAVLHAAWNTRTARPQQLLSACSLGAHALNLSADCLIKPLAFSHIPFCPAYYLISRTLHIWEIIASGDVFLLC